MLLELLVIVNTIVLYADKYEKIYLCYLPSKQIREKNFYITPFNISTPISSFLQLPHTLRKNSFRNLAKYSLTAPLKS